MPTTPTTRQPKLALEHEDGEALLPVQEVRATAYRTCARCGRQVSLAVPACGWCGKRRPASRGGRRRAAETDGEEGEA